MSEKPSQSDLDITLNHGCASMFIFMIFLWIAVMIALPIKLLMWMFA